VTVHALAARGQRTRVLRDLDVRIFALLLVVTVAGVIVGLARAGTYESALQLFRHGTFMSVAAISTTGLSTVAPRLLATDFGLIAPAALVSAMAVGGMAGSMAGGFKTLRAGFLLKGVVGDVRGVLLPESAYTRDGYEREGRREILTDSHIRSAATTVLLSLGAILVGAAVLLWVDGTVALREAILTATSAVSNVGLDTGILTAAAPVVVKLTFAGLMLLGRLEWLAVFASVAYLVAELRGRR
jgi:trk system potassium uptake protein TrkH